jgi:hypothetical protein
VFSVTSTTARTAATLRSLWVPNWSSDEAQDFNPAYWKMLRAMVVPGRNDMFIVGDAHQRIYDNYASLGSLGINIRGRSSRLTRCYRGCPQRAGLPMQPRTVERSGQAPSAAWQCLATHPGGAARWPTMTVSGLGASPDSTVLSTRTWSMKPLSARTVVVVATVVLLLTCGATTGLLWWVNTSGLTGTELITARLDAIRMGLSIAVGGSGVFALYLAWRRQRSNEADHQQRERTLEHHRQVADATNHDALERRITELYTKAADQLGSDKAPVRLAGIYALERLAQNNPDQRQTVVNVLCSYLRMPYTVIERHERIEDEPKGAEAEMGDVDPTATRKLEREQEMQVRLAAQRILAKHLRPLPSRVVETFWAGIELDLTGATLFNFDFSYCAAHEAAFDDARFYGATSFARANFGQKVSFTRAWFGEDARFVGVHVDGMALFAEARFEKDVAFNVAEFEQHTEFDRAQFVGSCSFNGAKLNRVDFMFARFDRSCFSARRHLAT